MITRWKRLGDTVADFLRQGMAPEKLAWCLALGATISICPILGVATPLLAALALMMRLNLPLIQLVNYAFTPLQWLLIIPFMRFGEWVCRVPPLPLSPAAIQERLQTDALGFMREFSMAGVCAAAGWLLVAVPLCALLVLTIRPLARRRLTLNSHPSVKRETR